MIMVVQEKRGDGDGDGRRKRGAMKINGLVGIYLASHE